MRLVSALLFIALTGSISTADEAKPADPKPEVTRRKVPLRVVRMLPETHQVLLFHRTRGTHVVAEVGQDLDGYVVDEIDDDEVTLIAPGGAEVILAAPDATWRKRAADSKATRQASKPVAAAAGPIDPYADPAEAAPAPITAGDGGVRVASASDKGPTASPITDANPADPYGDPGIAAFSDAVSAPAADAPAKSKTKAPAKVSAASADAAGSLAAAATGTTDTVKTTAATGTPDTAKAPAAFALTRGEVDLALADFGATAVTFDAQFVPDVGLHFDQIAAGTLLTKVGLRTGDVLEAVDGKPLRNLDDAAALYARAGKAKSATLAIVRDGKPLTVKVTIR